MTNKIRVLELFAGYGSQSLALKRLNIPHESHISEIDKYAIQAYNQLHGDTHNWGDICKIDEWSLPSYDLITYSFPCTSCSTAGRQEGLKRGSGTASSLLWECERIISVNRPKYLLMENVKALVGKKFKPDFEEWLGVLEQLGYNNYWQVLNAKDYGVPQNRERVFVVSIRKDVDWFGYQFPSKTPLERKLKDLLESEVDENYYLSDEKVAGFIEHSKRHFEKGTGFGFKPKNIETDLTANCLRANASLCPTDNMIYCAASRGRNPDNPSDRTAGSPTEQRLEVNQTGCSNTLTTVQKDNYIIQVGNLKQTDSFGGNPQTGRVYSSDGLSPCLNTMQGGGREPKVLNNTRIRKLTPRECFRLQGVSDEDFNKLNGISKTQLYKLAGNSIVVDVLENIFKNLLTT